MAEMGRMLLMVAAVLAVVGGGMLLASRYSVPRLPGDIVIKGRYGTFSFPLTTSIVLSIVLTLVLNLWLRHR